MAVRAPRRAASVAGVQGNRRQTVRVPLVLRRLATRLPVLGAVALVAGTFVVASAPLGLPAATDQGLRSLLTAPGAVASLHVETHLGTDATGQDAAARAVLHRRLGSDARVTRTTRVTLDSPRGPVELGSDADLDHAATLTAGRWATAAGGDAVEAAVQEDAARTLGLAPGDELQVGRPAVRVVVVGTWRADDVLDPRWGRSSLPASGVRGDVHGPFVVDERALGVLPGTVLVRWDVTPASSSLTASGVARLASSAEPGSVRTELERSGGVLVSSATVDGDLAQRAARARAAVTGAAVAVQVPLLVTAGVTLLTLGALAALLAASRSAETRLLRARGASVAQQVGWGAAEGALVALPAVALAWWASGATVASLGHAAGAAVASAAVLGAAAGTGGSGPGATGRVARVRAGALTVATVAVLVLTALGVQRLRALGPVAGGTWAPALLLVVLVVALVLAARPLLAWTARLAARRPTLVPVLAAREAARRPAAAGLAALVVALATGGGVLAAVVPATALALDRTAAAQRTGADVRLRLAAPGVLDAGTPAVTAVSFTAADGVRAATVTLGTTAQVGADDVAVVAVDARTVGRPVLVGAAPGPAVTGSVEASLSVDPAERSRRGSLEVTAWLVDAQGAVARVDLGSVRVGTAARGPAPVQAPVPDGVVPWSLAGLTVRLSGSPGGEIDVAVGHPGGASTLRVSSASPVARAVLAQAPERVPVAVGSDLARRAGLAPGAGLALRLRSGQDVGAVVADVLDPGARVPGAPAGLAVLADLATLETAVLGSGGPVPQPADVWLSTDAPARDVVASAVRRAPWPVEADTPASASVAGLLAPVVRVGTVRAAAGLGVALVACVAVGASLRRSRRDEDTVLRATGVRPRQLVALRTVELAGAGVGGVLAGALAGYATALVCTAPIAEAAVGDEAPALVAGAGAPAVGWALVGVLVVVAGHALVASRRGRS